MRIMWRSDEVWDSLRAYARETRSTEDLRAVLQRLQALDVGDPVPSQRVFRVEGRTLFGLAFGEAGLLIVQPHEALRDVLVVVHGGQWPPPSPR